MVHKEEKATFILYKKLFDCFEIRYHVPTAQSSPLLLIEMVEKVFLDSGLLFLVHHQMLIDLLRSKSSVMSDQTWMRPCRVFATSTNSQVKADLVTTVFSTSFAAGLANW